MSEKRETRDFEPDMSGVPRIGCIVRHFKGNFYEVVGFAWHTDYSDSQDDQLVLYRLASDRRRPIWARPLREFYEEVKNDEGAWVRRFEVMR